MYIKRERERGNRENIRRESEEWAREEIQKNKMEGDRSREKEEMERKRWIIIHT